jgi:branched-chain amino acid transport system substrate-binding protein
LLGFSLIAAACGGDDDDDAADEDDSTATTEAPEEEGPDPIAALRETGDADPSCTAETDGTFKVGGLLATSGDLGSILGAPQVAGATIAIDEINAAGGVLGNPIEFDQKDSGDEDPPIAEPAVQEHLQNGVDVILGASASGITRGVIDTIVESCTIEFSSSNTGPDFTVWDDDGLYFRSIAADVLQGRVLAELAIAEGAETGAIIYRQDTYGQGLHDYITSGFEDAGGEIVADPAYDPEASEFSAEIDEVVSSDPDAIFVVGFAESVTIVTDLAEQGFTPDEKKIYFVEGNMSDETAADLDEGAMVGIKGTIPGARITPEFDARLVAQNPNLPAKTYGPETYDALVVLALAAEAAGTDQADEVARQINAVTRDGTKCTTYQQCKDLIAAGTDIDYDGASGPLEFAKPGEPAAASYGIYTWNQDNTVSDTPEEFKDVSI